MKTEEVHRSIKKQLSKTISLSINTAVDGVSDFEDGTGYNSSVKKRETILWHIELQLMRIQTFRTFCSLLFLLQASMKTVN